MAQLLVDSEISALTFCRNSCVDNAAAGRLRKHFAHRKGFR